MTSPPETQSSRLYFDDLQVGQRFTSPASYTIDAEQIRAFAAQFDPNGSLRQLIIPKLNCPKAEAVLGGALKEMIEGGDYRPTGQSPGGWYRGEFSFDIDEASH